MFDQENNNTELKYNQYDHIRYNTSIREIIHWLSMNKFGDLKSLRLS